jgi:hypothetical protein
MRAITGGDEGPACASRDLLRLLVHTLIITRFLINNQARFGTILLLPRKPSMILSTFR